VPPKNGGLDNLGSNLLLKTLERHGNKLDRLCADVSALKQRARSWGAVAGMIAGAAAAIIVTVAAARLSAHGMEIDVATHAVRLQQLEGE